MAEQPMGKYRVFQIRESAQARHYHYQSAIRKQNEIRLIKAQKPKILAASDFIKHGAGIA